MPDSSILSPTRKAYRSATTSRARIGEGSRALLAIIGCCGVATENPSPDRPTVGGTLHRLRRPRSGPARPPIRGFVRLDHRHRTGGYRRSRVEAHETTAGSTSLEDPDLDSRSYPRHLAGCTKSPDSSASKAPERSSLVFPIAPQPSRPRPNCLPRETLSNDPGGRHWKPGGSRMSSIRWVG